MTHSVLTGTRDGVLINSFHNGFLSSSSIYLLLIKFDNMRQFDIIPFTS